MSRQALTTPDGDELLLDSVEGAHKGPRLIILHGLEGSSFSPYAQGMLLGSRRLGMDATVLNFRSCARRLDDRKTWIPNKRPRLYHSGDTADLDFVVRTFKKLTPEQDLLLFGVSLGANVILKWLGERGTDAPVKAAVAVSTPYDLGAGDRSLQQLPNSLYLRHFLPSLNAKLAHLAALYPDVQERCDLHRARRARSFFDFDDAATAPLHGFAGAADYYSRSSSIEHLSNVTPPTLCISAFDDPFAPGDQLHRVREKASDSVELIVTDKGGHVGFVSGKNPFAVSFWAEDLALKWLMELSSGSKEA